METQQDVTDSETVCTRELEDSLQPEASSNELENGLQEQTETPDQPIVNVDDTGERASGSGLDGQNQRVNEGPSTYNGCDLPLEREKEEESTPTAIPPDDTNNRNHTTEATGSETSEAAAAVDSCDDVSTVDKLSCHSEDSVMIKEDGCPSLNTQPSYSSEDSLLERLERELTGSLTGTDYTQHCALTPQNEKVAPNLQQTNGDLENSKAELDLYEVQMRALESALAQLQKEVELYKNALMEHDESAKQIILQMKQDTIARVDKVKGQLDQCQREKETIVLRYAQSEQNVIALRRQRDDLEKRIRDAAKEREALLGKMQMLSTERTRITQTLDAKCKEVNNLQKENERVREELTSKDIQIKWAQNRLRSEVDSHKDTQQKLQSTQQRLSEMISELEVQRKSAEDNRTGGSPAKTAEQQREALKNELDMTKSKLQSSVVENNTLTVKVQCLERERLEYEHNLSRLREELNLRQQQAAQLTEKLTEMELLRSHIESEREKLSASQSEVDRLRNSNSELQLDMQTCRRKEAELLEFTEKLTVKNVTLQADCSTLEARIRAADSDVNLLKSHNVDLEKRNSALSAVLEEEKQKRQQETHLLARKLAEKTKTVESLNVRVDEELNENKVLKRKQAASLRELMREVQILRRKLELYENGQHSGSGSNVETQSFGSRTSSNGSLDTIHNGHASDGANDGSQVNDASVSPVSDGSSLQVEPDRQALIERIVKLQRLHARKNDKIEFLEEHITQISNELKKKSRIIQNYILREDTGTLTTDAMDKNKMELTRRGGTIMASLYNSQPTDTTMSLDLSLEINHKLQSVLEDILLKNIMLKENINTLGSEIARLTINSRADSTPRNNDL